jgi:hypothetical protein
MHKAMAAKRKLTRSASLSRMKARLKKSTQPKAVRQQSRSKPENLACPIFAQTLESAKFDAMPRSAIRDWALLRYYPVKAVNNEKAPELGRKRRDVNPRMVGEAAENLKGYK